VAGGLSCEKPSVFEPVDELRHPAAADRQLGGELAGIRPAEAALNEHYERPTADRLVRDPRTVGRRRVRRRAIRHLVTRGGIRHLSFHLLRRKVSAS
jgi:hypothetical protein